MSRSPRPLLAAVALATATVLVAGTTTAPADAARPKKGSASFDSTSYVSGAGAIGVHGKVPGGKRSVKLQVKTKGGWVTIDKDRSNKKGKYSFATPLTWYGTHKVRVLAEGRRGFSKTKKVAVSPGYTPVGSSSDWALLRPGNAASFSFDPCKTVKYKVNVAQVDPSNLAYVQQAVNQISAATGIKVKYTGTTDIIPAAEPGRRFPGGTNLVIAFGSNAQVPQFAAGQADGLGGPRFIRSGRTAKGKRVAVITQSGVTLQTEGYRNYNPGFESIGKPGIGNLMLHEIGHAFGLDHSKGMDEMMTVAAWAPDADGVYRSRYAAGDLTGLTKVSLAQGCLGGQRSSRSAEVPAPAEVTLP